MKQFDIKKYSIVIILLFLTAISYAQFTLDYDFGIIGEYEDNDLVNEGPFSMEGLIELPNKKLLVFGRKKLTATTFGQTDGMIVRLNESGKVDSTFATNGIFRFDYQNSYDRFEDIEVLPNGKILVVGATGISGNMHGFVLRLNNDGSFDENFQNEGIKIIPRLTNGQEGVSNIIITPSEMYIAYYKGNSSYPGRQYAVLAKMNLNGEFDLNFGVNGFLEFPNISSPNASEDHTHKDFVLGLTNNNKIIATYEMANPATIILWQVNENGIIDTNFSDDGKFEINHAATGIDFKVKNDNKFIITTTIINETGGIDGIKVICLDETGLLDSNFGTDGTFDFPTTGGAISSYVYPDGSILLAGYVSGGNAGLHKLTADGVLDINFNNFSLNAKEGIQNFPRNGIFDFIPSTTNGRFYAVTRGLTFTSTNQIILPSSVIRMDEYITSSLHDGYDLINLSIYPNPTSSQLTIKYSAGTPILLEVHDLQGRRIFQRPFSKEINLDSLASGSYLLTIITSDGNKISKRIIKV